MKSKKVKFFLLASFLSILPSEILAAPYGLVATALYQKNRNDEINRLQELVSYNYLEEYDDKETMFLKDFITNNIETYPTLSKNLQSVENYLKSTFNYNASLKELIPTQFKETKKLLESITESRITGLAPDKVNLEPWDLKLSDYDIARKYEEVKLSIENMKNAIPLDLYLGKVSDNFFYLSVTAERLSSKSYFLEEKVKKIVKENETLVTKINELRKIESKPTGLIPYTGTDLATDISISPFDLLYASQVLEISDFSIKEFHPKQITLQQNPFAGDIPETIKSLLPGGSVVSVSEENVKKLLDPFTTSLIKIIINMNSVKKDKKEEKIDKSMSYLLKNILQDIAFFQVVEFQGNSTTPMEHNQSATLWAANVFKNLKMPDFRAKNIEKAAALTKREEELMPSNEFNKQKIYPSGIDVTFNKVTASEQEVTALIEGLNNKPIDRIQFLECQMPGVMVKLAKFLTIQAQEERACLIQRKRSTNNPLDLLDFSTKTVAFTNAPTPTDQKLEKVSIRFNKIDDFDLFSIIGQEECLLDSTNTPSAKEKKINITKKNIAEFEQFISDPIMSFFKRDRKSLLERDLAAYETQAPHMNPVPSEEIEPFSQSEDFEDYINLKDFVNAEDFTDLVIEKGTLLKYKDFDAFAENLKTAGLYKNKEWYCKSLLIEINEYPSLRAFEALTGQNVSLTFVKESNENKQERIIKMIQKGMGLSENPETETTTTAPRPNAPSETGHGIIKKSADPLNWDDALM